MRHILVAFVTVLGVAVRSTVATAQSAQNVPPVELTAQIGYLPLYGGDATVRGISTWAVSARVAYRLPMGPRHIALEAYLAHAPQDHDPYNRAPAFTFVGALARLSVRAGARDGVDPFLGVGLGRMRVDAEEIDCPPPNCFAEGGPGFRDARLTTWALDAGVLLPVFRWCALRGDVRLYVPLGGSSEVGSSAGVRTELAGGLSIRL